MADKNITNLSAVFISICVLMELLMLLASRGDFCVKAADLIDTWKRLGSPREFNVKDKTDFDLLQRHFISVSKKKTLILVVCREFFCILFVFLFCFVYVFFSCTTFKAWINWVLKDNILKGVRDVWCVKKRCLPTSLNPYHIP